VSKKTAIFIMAFIFFFGLFSCNNDAFKKKASQLAKKFIIVDTHIDLPYRLMIKKQDISKITQEGHFDYPRAKQGGLNVAFMSIYVAPKYQKTGGAKAMADSLIDLVENMVSEHPDKFVITYSVKDIKTQFAEGKISLPMGMENGAPIEGNLENLKHFYDRGIRYITLTHGKNNHICDSSYDTERKWNGLSAFGEQLIAEMNRLGIMIDISHVSDSTFYDIIKITKMPLIASHSSCRHFTPGWERNMDDEMIRQLAKTGGVIQITFGSAFLNETFCKASTEIRDKVDKYVEKTGLDEYVQEVVEYETSLWKEKALPDTDITEVVDHIDHVISLVGIDHVGLGSDFDGVTYLPIGLEDVSRFPDLIYEMLKRDYSEEDIEKICSGNILRVWSEVEKVASPNY